MKTHAEDKEIPCPYCDEVFPQRYILYEHLINDHEESSSLTCPVCNKVRIYLLPHVNKIFFYCEVFHVREIYLPITMGLYYFKYDKKKE